MHTRNSDDYNAASVAAAESVLVELMTILGPIKDHVLIVGGWAPKFLATVPADPRFQHIGSLDVDIALDPRYLTAGYYESLENALRGNKYELLDPSEDQPFTWQKEVNGIKVQVDLLTGHYGGADLPADHRLKKVLDAEAVKIKGCDLAFDLGVLEFELAGTLPDGTKDIVKIPLVTPLGFLVMKARALETRNKYKDAYDIWYVLRYCPDGISALIEQFKQHRHRTYVKEALEIFKRKYHAVDAVGPKRAADFDTRLTSQAEKDQRQQDAYQRVQQILRKLGEAS